MVQIQKARVERTRRFFGVAPFAVDGQLRKEIAAARRRAERMGLRLAVRLNGTSDIAVEEMIQTRFVLLGLGESAPDVQFYDYTKSFRRMLLFCEGRMPKNYHLTFSRSESNWSECVEVLKRGGNVAVVFEQIPQEYRGVKVVSGEGSDARFLDATLKGYSWASPLRGVIIGLLPKGPAKKDTTGFVVRAGEAELQDI